MKLLTYNPTRRIPDRRKWFDFLLEANKLRTNTHKVAAAWMFNTPLDYVTEAQRQHAKQACFHLAYGQPALVSIDHAAELAEQTVMFMVAQQAGRSGMSGLFNAPFSVTGRISSKATPFSYSQAFNAMELGRRSAPHFAEVERRVLDSYSFVTANAQVATLRIKAPTKATQKSKPSKLFQALVKRV